MIDDFRALSQDGGTPADGRQDRGHEAAGAAFLAALRGHGELGDPLSSTRATIRSAATLIAADALAPANV